MSRKSFTVLAQNCDIEPSRDGMVGVFNRFSEESGAKLHIRSIRSMQIGACNSDVTNLSGNAGIIGLYRVSAYSGGTELSFASFDTNASSLPSAVKMVRKPDSVTSSNLFRKFGDAFSFGITKAIPFHGSLRAPSINDGRAGAPEGTMVMWNGHSSNLEKIILREGEGIAAVRVEYGQPQATHWGIQIRVVSTGSTYRRVLYNTGSSENIGEAGWVLYNGSGSGVVLEVAAICFPDFGESNIPRFRVSRIDGIAWVSGDDVQYASVAGHDTATDVSGVQAYTGPFVARLCGWDYGIPFHQVDYQTAPISIAVQQRAGTYRHYLDSDPWYSLTHSPMYRGAGNDDVVWCPCFDHPIVLSAGEGVAVLGGGNGLVETSEMAYCDFEIIGEIVIPDVVPTGGVSKSRIFGGL